MQYSSSIIFEILFLTINVVQIDSRSNRKHHKRHVDDIEMNSCVNKASSEAHERFSKMFNRRDQEMYTFLKPTGQLFNVFSPVNGHELTVKPRSCIETASAEENNDLNLYREHPINRRATCVYQHVMNYNPLRVPASIVEVKCSCERVHLGGETYFCEPVLYDMKVMMFDEKCGDLVEKIEQISMACVTVHQLQSSGSDSIIVHKPTDPGAPV